MKKLKNFLTFIREQGVFGFAIAFILGGAVSKVVSSFVNDIINPILGLALGAAGDLSSAYIALGKSKIMYGSFINVIIDFIVVALVVYFGVKKLKLDKLDSPKK
ncbi:hypothetical protein A2X44_03235 [candidate division CPR3 bacterium GWF2_35_18]|uniref:Large-conductance mechanosensitive channel-like protein n=1 Tax=candidate division CPR3 bacterium GW2011_GWF2_35_18 TaxID=1618350 RepID=A0A0G0BJ61_UNCC3|nr:MAG: Large-conductance mechanosensitive channel-like protein [candidate division CPR3 bacterium GW2011_GWF2_35_18]KKP85353.1 MAG: Large-conductance mechanosensitive channel-like protein [candidate division CPR3 bacterium GW2011_GWE2_35_7]OGB62998.1 MAG: hypothetical protein A2X44_03235 [candidate division CPR3 bacterium GWF2_35_18]OGB63978.1 MAG: hypothetical protein A2250_02970 [candidate division CPR3 bacterium RIFOXYA2_FULL_35_13]OGB76181.1 MAG: hypothetical protein A2476_02675 [candidate